MAALVAVLALIGALQYQLGPRADWVESRRRRVLSRLHELLSSFGGYAEAQSPRVDYVCTVDIGEEELEKVLYQGGYHRNLLAAIHTRVLPDDAPAGAEKSEGSWVYRPSFLASRQHHGRLYPAVDGDGIDLYAHNEYSNIVRPIKHYRSKNMDHGDPNHTLRDALDAAGIDYTVNDDLVVG